MTNVGKTIYGYCNGFFGRDDYADKIIIAEGENWIVCKYCDDLDSGKVTFADFEDEDEKEKLIATWHKDKYSSTDGCF